MVDISIPVDLAQDADLLALLAAGGLTSRSRQVGMRFSVLSLASSSSRSFREEGGTTGTSEFVWFTLP